MPPEIYKGIDCTRGHRRPVRSIYVDPKYTLLTKPRDVILTGKNTPPSCDDSCYLWEITSGRGTLNTDTGKTVTWRPPLSDPMAPQTTRVAFYYGDRELDFALIATTKSKAAGVAYIETGHWLQQYYPVTEQFPPGWKPGDPIPKGMHIPEDVEFPEGWEPGDPWPKGVIIPEDAIRCRAYDPARDPAWPLIPEMY
jgi:hypothetical protein